MAMKGKLVMTLIIGALLIVVMTLLPLIRIGAWWIRIFDFPRVQIVTLGTGVAAGLTFSISKTQGTTVKWVVLALLIGCLCYQGSMIYPYTTIAKKQSIDVVNATEGSTLGILVANVYMHNRNSSQFLEIVNSVRADVILVTEADRWWEEALRTLESTFPYTIKQPQGNTYGMLLYSRYELLEPRVRFLVEDTIPSVYTKISLPSEEIIEFYGLHPRPPHLLHDSQERDAELLLVGREVADAQWPVIVAGDLNDVAWSYTTSLFQRISGLVDPRKGRGFYNTYHTAYPILRFPLDYVFHSADFRLDSMTRLPNFGSDHFPIYAFLMLTSPDAGSLAPPEESRSDHRKAEQLIDTGTSNR